MANNRMWIKCNHCGDKKTIMKYYPTWFDHPDPDCWGWSWYFIGEDDGTFDAWPHEHTHGMITESGPTHFSLEFEECDDNPL